MIYNFQPSGALTAAIGGKQNAPGQFTTALTSGTAVVPANTNVISHTGALSATLTLNLAASVGFALPIMIHSTNGITALTISGGTVVGGLTTIAPGATHILTYCTALGAFLLK